MIAAAAEDDTVALRARGRCRRSHAERSTAAEYSGEMEEEVGRPMHESDGECRLLSCECKTLQGMGAGVGRGLGLRFCGQEHLAIPIILTHSDNGGRKYGRQTKQKGRWVPATQPGWRRCASATGPCARTRERRPNNKHGARHA